MNKIDLVQRPCALPAPGFRDLYGDEILQRDAMIERITRVYRSYGFAPLETSAIERAEALGSFLPDADRPNAGVFAWQNPGDEDWVSLRYDLTAPLARYVAQNEAALSMPFRRYAVGPVWRNEKVAPGRYRQFIQCDADIVGAPSLGADGELCAMLCEALGAAGLKTCEFQVSLSNRKMLEGILELAGVPRDAVEQRGDILRSIDKLDRLGANEVAKLLGSGRTDASGDYTRGAGLTGQQVDLVLRFLASRQSDNQSTLNLLSEILGGSEVGRQGIADLRDTLLMIEANMQDAPVVIDPSMVRGLGYYTGTIMEAELTLEVREADGTLRRFGSIAGGGRYDGLVARFTGKDVPAVGVSIGVDRLLAALRLCDGEQPKPRAERPILVTVMDASEMASYQRLAADLRRAGLAAEVYYGAPGGFRRQLRYADRIGASYALIVGEAERATGTVQAKDLDLGRELASGLSQADWQSRPQQVEIPEADIASYLKAELAP